LQLSPQFGHGFNGSLVLMSHPFSVYWILRPLDAHITEGGNEIGSKLIDYQLLGLLVAEALLELPIKRNGVQEFVKEVVG